jgi:hypothetical protein
VLWRIFGSKREEDGSWRKLDNDELHSMCSSQNNVRVSMIKPSRKRWGGTCGMHGGGEQCLHCFGW